MKCSHAVWDKWNAVVSQANILDALSCHRFFSRTATLPSNDPSETPTPLEASLGKVSSVYKSHCLKAQTSRRTPKIVAGEFGRR